MTRNEKQTSVDRTQLSIHDLSVLSSVKPWTIRRWLETEPLECKVIYCEVYKIERFINEYLKNK